MSFPKVLFLSAVVVWMGGLGLLLLVHLDPHKNQRPTGFKKDS